MARYLGLFLIALCLETPIVAQETRTLLPSGFGSQGTGGINVLGTPLDGQWILMVGGSGGVRIGHSLVMGGGGYGCHTVRRNVAGTDERHEGGYGGFLIEYSALPRRVVHLTTSALIGPGGAVRRGFSERDDDRHAEPAIFFLAIQPSMAITLNVTPFLRVSVESAYRHLIGAGSEGRSLSGPGIGAKLRLGAF